MTFELVYRSSKGNKNYWTTKHHFTRKESDHYQWETIQRMNTEFPQLKFNYPTLFAIKRLSALLSGFGSKKLAKVGT